jgi:D-alanine transfer protein
MTSPAAVPPFHERAPHLAAAALALAISVGLLAILFGPLRLERRLSRLAAPEMLEVKDQSVGLQEAAFGDRNLLPVYGSSEFRNDTPFAGRVFFSQAPTGFELFTVGKAGAKTLIIAERLAALGNAIRGRKVVIILSPTWFVSPPEPADAYDGNFSALQAEALVFDSPISRSLKRRFAREMLKQPASLASHGLLKLELQRLAAGRHSIEDRLIGDLGRPEVQFQQLLDRAESAFALSGEILDHPAGLSEASLRTKSRPDWPQLLAAATDFARKNSYATPRKHARARLEKGEERLENLFDASKNPRAFVEALARSDEWGHLDILLRTLKELGARPLFLSIPLNATAFESVGVPPDQLALYYATLRREIGAYGFPVETFERHQNDPAFFGDSMGHPSAKGWMTFNRTMSAFYHGKLPTEGAPPPK